MSDTKKELARLRAKVAALEAKQQQPASEPDTFVDPCGFPRCRATGKRVNLDPKGYALRVKERQERERAKMDAFWRRATEDAPAEGAWRDPMGIWRDQNGKHLGRSNQAAAQKALAPGRAKKSEDAW